jgi:hypothetical protein
MADLPDFGSDEYGEFLTDEFREKVWTAIHTKALHALHSSRSRRSHPKTPALATNLADTLWARAWRYLMLQPFLEKAHPWGSQERMMRALRELRALARTLDAMDDTERIWFAAALTDLPADMIARPVGDDAEKTEYLPEEWLTHVARAWPQIVGEADKAANLFRRLQDRPKSTGRPRIREGQREAIKLIAGEWRDAYGEAPAARENSPFMSLLEAVYHYAAPGTKLPSAPTVRKTLRELEG